MNEHLMHVQDGDQDTLFEIPMAGFDFSEDSQAGLVPKGNYRLKIVSAQWIQKKNKEGKNLKVVFSVAQPEKYQGITIVEHWPAPVGDASDSATAFGLRRVRGMFGSLTDNLGKLEEAKNAGTIKIPLRNLASNFVTAELKQEITERGNMISRIASFISAKQFAENPGPIEDEQQNLLAGARAELFPAGVQPTAPVPLAATAPQVQQPAASSPAVQLAAGAPIQPPAPTPLVPGNGTAPPSPRPQSAPSLLGF